MHHGVVEFFLIFIIRWWWYGTVTAPIPNLEVQKSSTSRLSLILIHHLQCPAVTPRSVFTILTLCISIIHLLNMHISTHTHKLYLVHMSVISQPEELSRRRISLVSIVRMRSVEHTGAASRAPDTSGSTVSWWEPRTGYRVTSPHTDTRQALSWHGVITYSEHIYTM